MNLHSSTTSKWCESTALNSDSKSAFRNHFKMMQIHSSIFRYKSAFCNRFQMIRICNCKFKISIYCISFLNRHNWQNLETTACGQITIHRTNETHLQYCICEVCVQRCGSGSFKRTPFHDTSSGAWHISKCLITPVSLQTLIFTHTVNLNHDDAPCTVKCRKYNKRLFPVYLLTRRVSSNSQTTRLMSHQNQI